MSGRKDTIAALEREIARLEAEYAAEKDPTLKNKLWGEIEDRREAIEKLSTDSESTDDAIDTTPPQDPEALPH